MNWLQKTCQTDAALQLADDVRKVLFELEKAREVFSFWQDQLKAKGKRPYGMPQEVFRDPLSFVKSIIDQTEPLTQELRERREAADQTVRQEWLDAYVSDLWSKWYLLSNDYQMAIAQINSRN